MKTSIIVSIAVLLIILIGAFALYNSQSTGKVIVQDEEKSKIQTEGFISASELSSHNVQSDCWVGFQGKVYDITLFLPKHPGSAEAIISYCGTSTEFENAFIGKHGMSKISNLVAMSVFKGDLN